MRRSALGLAFILCLAQRAAAIDVRAGSLGGLMTQPTSSYYHVVYGGYGEVAREDGDFLFRGGYLERPEFTAAGFKDQEFFGFGLFGTRVFDRKAHGLNAFFGGGQTTGFLRDEAGGHESRHYRVPALGFAAEYFARWRALDVALQHQLLIGHVSDQQLRAYVAWPYSFLLLRLGIVL